MLDEALYDIEHALSLYAYSFVHFPAASIYDKEGIAQFADTIATCHIYIVGFLPIVRLATVSSKDGALITQYEVLGKTYDLSWPMPEGGKLVEGDQGYYVDLNGERAFPSEAVALLRLDLEYEALTFDVQYVGQAFGQDGSRNALDRLTKHETLQKISLTGVPEGYRLEILLLAIQPANTMITIINPFATDKSDSEARISAGLDKLYGTSEKERISLYEAALIRYFQPKFNKEFKDSFPSTNLKVLQDCYEKDFLALVAEIVFDRLPYRLCSATVPPKREHLALYDLHKQEDRRAFFVIPPTA